MSDQSFASLYCQNHHLSSDEYEKVVLSRCLYPHARWAYQLIRLVRHDHFVADIELVRNVGSLRRCRDFRNDVQQFLHHPTNCGMLRRTFNFRISTKMLRRLMHETLHPESLAEMNDETAVPFATTECSDSKKSSSDVRKLTA